MYEVEYKVEISEAQRSALILLFVRNDFNKKSEVLQNDYYIWAQESPYGEYDIKRYRDEGEKFFYTEKVWENVDGQKARREVEKEISKEELDQGIKNSEVIMKIEKTRQPFVGKYKDKEIHIDMDSVKFDHSPNIRYFIEAEIVSDTNQNIKELKELMKNFLKESLGKEDIVESPGMFVMASRKL